MAPQVSRSRQTAPAARYVRMLSVSDRKTKIRISGLENEQTMTYRAKYYAKQKFLRNCKKDQPTDQSFSKNIKTLSKVT
jgi:hypothetical protein